MTTKQMEKRLAEVKEQMKEVESEREFITFEFVNAMDRIASEYNKDELTTETLMNSTSIKARLYVSKMEDLNKLWKELEEEAIELVNKI